METPPKNDVTPRICADPPVESCLDAQNPGGCIMLQLWKLHEVLPDLEEQMPHGKNPPWCHGKGTWAFQYSG